MPPIARLSTCPGPLPLPLRLHGPTRRHRDRRHRAGTDVLALLRRPVPAAAARGLRPAPRREARRAQARASGSSTPAGPAGPAGEGHRMPIAGDARAPAGSALRQRSTRSSSASTTCSASSVPVTVPGVDAGAARPSLDLARSRGVRRVRPGELGRMFHANFERFEQVDPEVAAAGPLCRRLPRRERVRSGSVGSVEATHDVLVIGAGCAGMRAAIEAFDAGADVARRLEAPPDAQPLRRRRGRDQRRARQLRRRQPGDARLRHGQGLRLPGRPGRGRDLHARGAGRHLPARALGRDVLAERGGQARPAAVRRGGRRRAPCSQPTSPGTC